MNQKQTIMSNTNQTQRLKESQAFWKKHYDLYKQSSLSKAAYARTHNIAAHRFVYWCRKLSERAESPKGKFIPVELIKPRVDCMQPPLLSKEVNENLICTVVSKQGTLRLYTEKALKIYLDMMG